MKSNLKFEKTKNSFINQKMKKTMDELQRVKKRVKAVQQIIVEKEENEQEEEDEEGENEEDIIILN